MKFAKTVIVSLAVLFSAVAQAQSWEEICHDQVESAVKHKYYFKKYPDALSSSLKRLEDSGLDKKLQAKIRADLFFIENRKDISDETFRRLVFVRCIRQAQE